MPISNSAPGDDVVARLEFARDVVREAGALALLHFRDANIRVERKGIQDYVTVVDRAVETLIIERLRGRFPQDGFLGEEGGYRNGSGNLEGMLWVIDPIDGTTNYTHGLPLWCISVALLFGGKIVLGLIFNPVTDEFYCAALGKGATCNGQPIHVSSVLTPETARIGMGFSYRRPPSIHAMGIERLLSSRCEYARFGSGALGMAFVADGRFDGYWEPHINAWDVAAGICLVREAGGVVNDFLDAGGLLGGNPILACVPALRAFLDDKLMSLCVAADSYNGND
jgi:myo-inositol-1(or 4)-monophosphatase